MFVSTVILALYLVLVAMVYFNQSALLYFPSHDIGPTQLSPWTEGQQVIGYCRTTPHPKNIWLMTHGNGGQAGNRDYVLPHLSDDDAFYVLEYPGYGPRPGKPTLHSINAAASEAYQLLRKENPGTPICVLGESLGTGPACLLARQEIPPDKIVLVVPYDSLLAVAARRFFFLPTRLILRDAWDNVDALKQYHGPVEIYGAKKDTIIPIQHARELARQVPGAKFIEINSGHNEWADQEEVQFRR